ncbi:MAG: hypothetical protein GY834_12240 [Bacteroidetes bacterium]|nr:hypothetical protein [Bacteroidota bacterium]
MKIARFIKYFNLMLLCIFINACNNIQTGEKILADTEFFNKNILSVVDDAKKQCEEKLNKFYQGKAATSDSDSEMSMSSRIDIPLTLQPYITDIEKKYGKPDKIVGNVHYFGKIGFKVGEMDSVKVTRILIICSRHPKNDL